MVCEEFSLCPAEIPLRSQGMLKVNLKKEGHLYRHSLHFIHYFQLDLFFPLYGVMKTCYVKYSSDCNGKITCPVWSYIIFVSCLVCIPKCTCVANRGSERAKQLQATLSPNVAIRPSDAQGREMLPVHWRGTASSAGATRPTAPHSIPTEMVLWDHTSPFVKAGSLFKVGWLGRGGTVCVLGAWPHVGTASHAVRNPQRCRLFASSLVKKMLACNLARDRLCSMYCKPGCCRPPLKLPGSLWASAHWLPTSPRISPGQP